MALVRRVVAPLGRPAPIRLPPRATFDYLRLFSKRGNHMGGMKRLLEQQQELRAWAVSFLVECGTLKACQVHEGAVYDGDGDLPRAYKILNAKVTRGEIGLAKGQSRRDLTDALEEAYDDNSHASTCWACDKLRDE